MKAMLAKGFKKEKSQQKYQEVLAEDRGFRLEEKHEHYDSVKQRKRELDQKFTIKMNAASKKYNERQSIVSANRQNNMLSRRNVTIDNVAGSNSQLEYPMSTS